MTDEMMPLDEQRRIVGLLDRAADCHALPNGR